MTTLDRMWSATSYGDYPDVNNEYFGVFDEDLYQELCVMVVSIGVRGAGLVEASECDQLSLFLDDARRQKRERIEGVVDSIRSRFGYMSIQRAAIFADPQLAGIRPKEHVVHPVGYFGR